MQVLILSRAPKGYYSQVGLSWAPIGCINDEIHKNFVNFSPVHPNKQRQFKFAALWLFIVLPNNITQNGKFANKRSIEIIRNTYWFFRHCQP